jgi:hypothetical protein
MSCTLRAGGTDFDVNSFLASSSLTPCAVFRRGEPKFPASQPNGPIRKNSGINVGVSDAEFGDEQNQTRDALNFLEEHEHELKRLAEYPGVEVFQIDFAIEAKDVFVQSYCFQPNLLFLIGRLGIELCVSYYPASEEEPEEEQLPTSA